MELKMLVAVFLAVGIALLLPACRESPVEEAVEIPLEPYIGRLPTIRAAAGSTPLRLIFDTGGGETIISPAIAATLGCVPTGRGVGYRASGERIEYRHCPQVTLTIGGVAFEHEEIAVWDVQAVLPEGVPPVDGVLSLKTFRSRPFTLRLADGLLVLESDASLARRVTAMAALRTRLATGASGGELTVFAHAGTPHPAWYLLDSGNLDVVRVAPQVAGRDAGATWNAELALDGLPARPAEFRSVELIHDGVLSEAYLREWTLTFDLAHNRVWATPAADR